MAQGTGTHVTTVTPEFDTDQKGRNPELTGIPHDIYLFVRDNPGTTRREITKALGLRWNSGTARIKHMLDAGLLIENGTVVDKLSHRKVAMLYAPTDFQHKAPRDRVRVTVHLIVDDQGNYHAEAWIAGGQPFNKRRKNHVVLTKDITVIAPYPNEYRASFLKEKVSKVEPRDTLANSKLIIDG